MRYLLIYQKHRSLERPLRRTRCSSAIFSELWLN
jgi:hypothetical protein